MLLIEKMTQKRQDALLQEVLCVSISAVAREKDCRVRARCWVDPGSTGISAARSHGRRGMSSTWLTRRLA